MINKISHITLYTNDQDETMKFYVEKLGFKVHTDMPFGEERWLTLTPAQQDNFELVIFNAVAPDAQAFVGKQAPHNVPFLVLSTDNCKGDYERLKAAGVEFIKEPTQEMWGTEALFKDPLGNVIDMVQAN